MATIQTNKIAVRSKHQQSPKVIKCLDHGIFPGYTMFSCGFSAEEFIKELRKQKADGWLEAFEGHKIHDHAEEGHWCAGRTDIEDRKTGKLKTYFFIVLPSRFEFSDECYIKLSHEVTHIYQFFLPDALDRNREIEAEAYFHSHLMRQCLSLLRK